MNSYERDVIAQQQRRRQWQMRSAAMLAGAVVIVATFWAADVPNKSWWQGWFASEPAAPTAASPPPPVLTPPSTAPQSSPQFADDGAVGKLRLIATQPGRNAREGTAQISTGPANPLTYIAGALLANGASLAEVHPDHVVLKRDALTTRLYVDGAARNARAPKSEAVLEELITVEAPTQPSKPAKPPPMPETFANLMRTAPRFADSAVIGFEVYSGTDAGALSRLNLQSGDVVTEMDGSSLTSVEQLHRSLKAISGGASVMATVVRGSEQIVVTLDGAALKAQPPPGMPGLPL
jgi:hypothetical protein